MKAIFTQAGPGLSISQGGLGPIVQLGFGVTGAPATLSNAPLVSSLLSTDAVLISRSGLLCSISWTNFVAAIVSALHPPPQAGTAGEVAFNSPQNPIGTPPLLLH